MNHAQAPSPIAGRSLAVALGGLALALCATGCSFDTDLAVLTFECETDDECVAGQTCDPIDHVCVLKGTEKDASLCPDRCEAEGEGARRCSPDGAAVEICSLEPTQGCLTWKKTVCDDWRWCTEDRCEPDTLVCTFEVAEGCLIDDACFAEGMPEDPNLARCAFCVPEVSTTAWSVVVDGRPCQDDGLPCTADVCTEAAGDCAHTLDDRESCLIDQACVAKGALAPDGPCGQCDPDIDPLAYSLAPDGQACSDDNPCTTGDQCSEGACIGGAEVPCEDDLPCTTLVCDPATGSCPDAPEIHVDFCLIGGQCVAAGEPAPGSSNDCLVCNPLISNTSATEAASGTDCQAGDLCRVDATCMQGTCVGGEELDCSDSVSCTVDTCMDGVCHNEDVEPNKCFIDGQCYGAGETLGGNACTTCQPSLTNKGWSPAPDGTPCSDDDPCTASDACQAGACTQSTPKDCNDFKFCTLDSCDSDAGPDAPCVHTLAPDTCLIDGACLAQGALESSGGCTACLPDASPTEWSALPVDTPCSDGDPCTLDDTCGGLEVLDVVTASGVCDPGQPRDCDDGISCTTDTCVVATGSCESALDTGEACLIDGECRPHKESPPGNPCLVCLADSNPVGWTVWSDGTPCHAGNPCTVDDTCQAGVCTAGDALDCDDGHPCTDDLCDPELPEPCSAPSFTGCLIDAVCFAEGDGAPHNSCLVCDLGVSPTAWSPSDLAMGLPCDDGDPCTEGDTCSDNGGCYALTDVLCDDGLSCTADSCDVETGSCIFTVAEGCLIDGACVDDGVVSTDNLCVFCDPAQDPQGWSPASEGEMCHAYPGGTAVCQAGQCAFSCPEGRADCDEDPITGCEADTLTTPGHCGGCQEACPEPTPYPCGDDVCEEGERAVECPDDCERTTPEDFFSCVDTHCVDFLKVLDGYRALPQACCESSECDHEGLWMCLCEDWGLGWEEPPAFCSTGIWGSDAKQLAQVHCGLDCESDPPVVEDPFGNFVDTDQAVWGYTYLTTELVPGYVDPDMDEIFPEWADEYGWYVLEDLALCAKEAGCYRTEVQWGAGCVDGACVEQCGDLEFCVVCDDVSCEELCVDTDSSEDHCGNCTTTCSHTNAQSECVSGDCHLTQCHAGWMDADGDSIEPYWASGSLGYLINGCECPYQGPDTTCDGLDNDCSGVVDDVPAELLTDDDAHCGGCHLACTATDPWLVGRCLAGACHEVYCGEGTVNLDGHSANGCEYACSFVSGDEPCNGIDDNCDGQVDELHDLLGDPANCGACGHGCESEVLQNPATVVGLVCVAGSCRISGCTSGFKDLNGEPADGCEDLSYPDGFYDVHWLEGSAEGDGSAQSPFRTIQAAIDQVPQDNTSWGIRVAGGFYAPFHIPPGLDGLSVEGAGQDATFVLVPGDTEVAQTVVQVAAHDVTITDLAIIGGSVGVHAHGTHTSNPSVASQGLAGLRLARLTVAGQRALPGEAVFHDDSPDWWARFPGEATGIVLEVTTGAVLSALTIDDVSGVIDSGTTGADATGLIVRQSEATSVTGCVIRDLVGGHPLGNSTSSDTGWARSEAGRAVGLWIDRSRQVSLEGSVIHTLTGGPGLEASGVGGDAIGIRVTGHTSQPGAGIANTDARCDFNERPTCDVLPDLLTTLDDGSCTRSLPGDGVCDAALACLAWGYDGGDCPSPPECPEGTVRDPRHTSADNAVGDGAPCVAHLWSHSGEGSLVKGLVIDALQGGDGGPLSNAWWAAGLGQRGGAAVGFKLESGVRGVTFDGNTVTDLAGGVHSFGGPPTAYGVLLDEDCLANHWGAPGQPTGGAQPSTVDGHPIVWIHDQHEGLSISGLDLTGAPNLTSLGQILVHDSTGVVLSDVELGPVHGAAGASRSGEAINVSDYSYNIERTRTLPKDATGLRLDGCTACVVSSVTVAGIHGGRGGDDGPHVPETGGVARGVLLTGGTNGTVLEDVILSQLIGGAPGSRTHPDKPLAIEQFAVGVWLDADSLSNTIAPTVRVDDTPVVYLHGALGTAITPETVGTDTIAVPPGLSLTNWGQVVVMDSSEVTVSGLTVSGGRGLTGPSSPRAFVSGQDGVDAVGVRMTACDGCSLSSTVVEGLVGGHGGAAPKSRGSAGQGGDAVGVWATGGVSVTDVVIRDLVGGQGGDARSAWTAEDEAVIGSGAGGIAEGIRLEPLTPRYHLLSGRWKRYEAAVRCTEAGMALAAPRDALQWSQLRRDLGLIRSTEPMPFDVAWIAPTWGSQGWEAPDGEPQPWTHWDYNDGEFNHEEKYEDGAAVRGHNGRWYAYAFNEEFSAICEAPPGQEAVSELRGLEVSSVTGGQGGGGSQHGNAHGARGGAALGVHASVPTLLSQASITLIRGGLGAAGGGAVGVSGTSATVDHALVAGVIAGDGLWGHGGATGVRVSQALAAEFMTVTNVWGGVWNCDDSTPDCPDFESEVDLRPNSGVAAGDLGGGDVSLQHVIVAHAGWCFHSDDANAPGQFQVRHAGLACTSADNVAVLEGVVSDAEPGFVNGVGPGWPYLSVPGDDYHLAPGASGVDAGLSGASNCEAFAQEPAPNGCAANLGAYGNTPEATVNPDAIHCPCDAGGGEGEL